MQILFIILIIIALLTSGYFIYQTTRVYQSKDASVKNKTIVKINDNVFAVEVADTPASRQVGLMNRSSMENDNGMLFIFERSGVYPFWMKNTLIPLDIIWINDQKQIAYIAENAQPCKNTVQAVCESIFPNATAKYVLEINGGLAKQLDIKVGDNVEF